MLLLLFGVFAVVGMISDRKLDEYMGSGRVIYLGLERICACWPFVPGGRDGLRWSRWLIIDVGDEG